MAAARSFCVTVGGLICANQGAIAIVAPPVEQPTFSQAIAVTNPQIQPLTSLNVTFPKPEALPTIEWQQPKPQEIAQLIPDETTGSIVTLDQIVRDQAVDLIQGGTSSGSNLFHSFSEFNIGDHQNVYFANPNGIENILTRVTGTHHSNIFGTLGVDGAANLFLINPNGIHFGQNARLDISGSFTASTADGIMLGEGAYFSATDLPNSQFLSVQPGALFQNPIRNYTVSINNEGKLEIGAGETLTLQSDIVNHSGSLITQGGTVQILGDRLNLTGDALVDVSSIEGNGGTILIGGDFQGKGDLPTAQNTVVGSEVQLLANGSNAGGKVIVWADGSTNFAGTLEAKGEGGFAEISGKQYLDLAPGWSQNIEVSNLLFDPTNIEINNSAGSASISNPYTASTIFHDDIENFLSTGGSLTITTAQSNTPEQAGDITVKNGVDIQWSTNNNFNLVADRSIIVEQGVIISSSGSGNITFEANYTNATTSKGATTDGTSGNAGISLEGATISTNGNITLNAFGANGLDAASGGAVVGGKGISISGANTLNGATVTLNGTGGKGGNGNNTNKDGANGGLGIQFASGATIQANQILSLNGTGGSLGDKNGNGTAGTAGTGISIGAGVTIGSGQSLSLTGTGGNAGGNTSDDGIPIQFIGDIILKGDEIELNSTVNATGANLTIQTASSGQNIEVGGTGNTTDTLNLTATELGRLTGLNSLKFELQGISTINLESLGSLSNTNKITVIGDNSASQTLKASTTDDVFVISGVGAGNLDLGGGGVDVSFSRIEVLDGGVSGTDTLNGSISNTSDTFTISGANALNVAGISFYNIDKVDAGDNIDVIIGRNTGETFALSATNKAVNVAGIDFTQIENVNAGSSTSDEIAGTPDDEAFFLTGNTGEVQAKSIDFTGIETIDAGGQSTGDRLIGSNITNENFTITGIQSLTESVSNIAFSDIEIVNARENGTTDIDTVTGTSGNDSFEIIGNEILTSNSIRFTQIENLDTSTSSDTVNFATPNSSIQTITSTGSQLTLSGTVGDNLTAETSGILNVTNLTTDDANTDAIDLSGNSLNVTNSNLSALNTIDLSTTGGNLQLTGSTIETTTDDLRDDGGDIKVSTCDSLSSTCTGSIIIRDNLTNPFIAKASGNLSFIGESIDFSFLNADSNLQSGSLSNTSGDLNILAYKTVSITDTITEPFNLANVDGDLLIQSGANRDVNAPSDPSVDQQGILLSSTSFLSDLNNEEFIYEVTGSAILKTDGEINISNVDLNSGEFTAKTLDGNAADISSDTGVVISAIGDVKFGNYTGLSLKVEAGGSIFVLGDILITGAASPFDVISGYDSAEALGSSVLTFLDGGTTSLQAADIDNEFPSLAVWELESALGLPSGILSDASFTGIDEMATEGSALKLTYTLAAGESLSIPINQNFFSYEGLPYNDFAFISVVNSNGEISLNPIASVANAGSNPQTITLDNSSSMTANTFSVGIGVVDVIDTYGFSALNVTAASAFDPDFGILSGSPSVILRAGVGNIQDTPYDVAPTVTRGGALFEPTSGGSLPAGSISLQGKINTSGDENTGGNLGGNVILSATGDIEIATNLAGSATTLMDGDTLIKTAAANNSDANAGYIDITAEGKITIGSPTNEYDLDLSASGDGQAGSLKIVSNKDVVEIRNLNILTSVEDGDKGIGGNVEIEGTSVTLNRTNIDAASFASNGQSGNVMVTASQNGAVTLTSDALLSEQSTIFTDTFATTGDRQTGGDIILTGGAINIDNYRLNAQVTDGLGGGGNISIVATGESGAAPINSNGELLESGEVRIQNSSKILTTVTAAAAGKGGDITISGETVTIQDQGTLVSADTASNEVSGTGGIITVLANEQISLSDGAKISAQTSGAASGGEVFLGKAQPSASTSIETATNNIIIDNASISSSSLGITADAAGGTTQLSAKNLALINSEIAAFSTGLADSGKIILDGGLNNLGEQIYTDQISLTEGSLISISAFSEGSSQSIELFTNGLTVLAGSGILAETNSTLTDAGGAGNITIKADPNSVIANFLISGTNNFGDSSKISTATKGGLGGDIIIEAESGNIEVGDRGLITAETSGVSSGGDIELQANTLNINSGGRILTTSSSSATAGAITVDADSVIIQGIANAQTFDDQINPDLVFDIVGNVQPFGSGVLISNGFGSKDISLLNSNANFLANIPVNIIGTEPTEGSQFKLFIDPLLVGIDPTTTNDITFSFDLTFATGESSSSGNTFNDFAYLLASNIAAAMGLSADQISDLQASQAIEIFDTNGGTTQTQTFTFTLDNVGSSDFDLGVVDVADTVVDSSVLISNYKINNIPIALVTNNIREAQTSGIFAEAIAGGSAGTIAVNTDQLSVNQGGEIAVSAKGDGTAGAILITAPEINLGSENIISGGRITASTESGSGGSITFANTESLAIFNGLVTSSTGSGVAGDITVGTDINPVSDITLQGNFVDPVSGMPQLGGLAADATNGGTAGSIEVFANNLNVNTGSAIAVSATGTGTAGDISVTASEVTINGGEISAETEVGGASNPANIDIKGVNNLTITDGLISTSTKTGLAGDVTVDATGTVALSGQFEGNEGGIKAEATAGGDAGSVTVNANQLNVDSGAAIAVSAEETGTAGNIDITANYVNIDGGEISATTEAGGSETKKANITLEELTRLNVTNGGSINSSTVSGQAGDIRVTALGDLNNPIDGIITVDNGSEITSSTETGGKAGSITLISDQLNVNTGAAIAVSAEETGTAGNIDITADYVSIDGGEISATTEAGGSETEKANIILKNLTTLDVENGGSINSSTVSGQAGDVLVTALGDLEDPIDGKIMVTGDSSAITSSASGGGKAGSVTLISDQLNVETGAAIAVSAEETGTAGNIDITADYVSIDGGEISATTEAGGSETEKANITLAKLTRLDVENGGSINSSTVNGQAGDILVTALGDLNNPIDGKIMVTGDSSAITSSASEGGKAGSVTLISDQLNVETGAAITVSAEETGTAGNIDITADYVSIDGGEISATTEAGGSETEKANITLAKLTRLDVENGGSINSSTVNGQAGDILVTALGDLNNPIDGIITVTGNGSKITSSTETGGKAGSVTLISDQLNVNAGAAIAVNAGGTGTAGNIVVNVPDVTIDGGSIAATTEEGGTTTNAANINLNVRKLDVINQGEITSSTESGVAGNITVDSTSPEGMLTVNVTNSLIESSAGNGIAGNILLDAQVITLGGALQSGEEGGIKASSTGDGGTAGSIAINAEQLNVNTGAAIAVSAGGTGIAGDLEINVPDVNINGGQIAASTVSGSGGSITFDHLTNLDVIGGLVTSSTESGTAGAIKVNSAKDALTNEPVLVINLANPFSASQKGGLLAEATQDGQAGAITLEASQLNINQGAAIAVNAAGTGSAGAIKIDAPIINLNGGEIAAKTEDGSGGAVTLETLKLTIQNAGEIDSSTEGGQAGNVFINIPDNRKGSIILDGQGSQISASTTGENSDGIGGNIVINEPWEIIIRNGAQIATDSEGLGKGGDIDISTKNLVMQNQSLISSRTQTSDGGNITITIEDVSNISPLENFGNVTNAVRAFNQNFNNNFDERYLDIINALWLSGGSNISSTAGSAVSGGNGGNINIITPWVIAAPKQNNNITANAFFGNGGKINVTTNYLFGIAFTDEDIPVRNDITASSQFGSDGTVLISTLGVDPTSGLIELPEELVDADSLIGNNACALDGGKIAGGSSLVVKGKGGLPVNPNESLNTINGLIGFIPLPNSSNNLLATTNAVTEPELTNINANPVTIQQAYSWQLSEKGKVTLTTDANQVLAQRVGLQHPDCGSISSN